MLNHSTSISILRIMSTFYVLMRCAYTYIMFIVIYYVWTAFEKNYYSFALGDCNRHGQTEIVTFSSMSRSALGPIHPPAKWVQEFFPEKQKPSACAVDQRRNCGWLGIYLYCTTCLHDMDRETFSLFKWLLSVTHDWTLGANGADLPESDLRIMWAVLQEICSLGNIS